MNTLEISGVIYLVGVLATGIILYRKSVSNNGKAELPALAIAMLLWPPVVLVLFGVTIGDAIARYRIRKRTGRIERLKRQFLQSIISTHPELDGDERLALANLMVDLTLALEDRDDARGAAYPWLGFERVPLNEIKHTLTHIWEPPEPEVGSDGLAYAFSGIDPESDRILFSIGVRTAGKDEWGFHMTHAFRKSIKDLDKNLRGRVLDAITEICMKPMELRGDTVKPLTGELQGFWRYRLGDYRLIYHPDPNAHRIDLISIGGRGQVYTH
jgi:addiction module RelE/StbE family toxin